MSLTLNIVGRDARDRLVGLLGLGVPHPLRDLELRHAEMGEQDAARPLEILAAQDVQPEIQVVAAQAGVRYQLCNDDGDPRADVPPVDGTSSDQPALLLAPKVKEDIAYSILASRHTEQAQLETYLIRRVSIRAGINTKLTVRFEAAPGQVGAGNQIATPFGTRVTVIVETTQEGVFYQLVAVGPDDAPLDPAERLGNQQTLRFTTQPLAEDLALRIKATRKVGKLKPAYLETSLTVAVGADPSVPVVPKAPILDYGRGTEIVLNPSQPTATYRLFKRTLVPQDYGSAATVNALAVPADDDRTVFLSPPDRPPGAGLPVGFEPVGPFAVTGKRPPAVSTGPLLEDTFFIVEASKANGERTLLTATVALLVRPNPAPEVTVEASPIPPGAEGTVLVTGTQRGVHYQLVAGNRPINPPGYHYEDRGIEAARLEVDFAVEGFGDQRVLLPTGKLEHSTEFGVIARKTRTGLTATLTDGATINLTTSADGPQAASRSRAAAPRPTAKPTPEPAEPSLTRGGLRLAPTPPPPPPRRSTARRARRQPSRGTARAKPGAKAAKTPRPKAPPASAKKPKVARPAKAARPSAKARAVSGSATPGAAKPSRKRQAPTKPKRAPAKSSSTRKPRRS